MFHGVAAWASGSGTGFGVLERETVPEPPVFWSRDVFWNQRRCSGTGRVPEQGAFQNSFAFQNSQNGSGTLTCSRTGAFQNTPCSGTRRPFQNGGGKFQMKQKGVERVVIDSSKKYMHMTLTTS